MFRNGKRALNANEQDAKEACELKDNKTAKLSSIVTVVPEVKVQPRGVVPSQIDRIFSRNVV